MGCERVASRSSGQLAMGSRDAHVRDSSVVVWSVVWWRLRAGVRVRTYVRDGERLFLFVHHPPFVEREIANAA